MNWELVGLLVFTHAFTALCFVRVGDNEGFLRGYRDGASDERLRWTKR